MNVLINYCIAAARQTNLGHLMIGMMEGYAISKQELKNERLSDQSKQNIINLNREAENIFIETAIYAERYRKLINQKTEE